MPHPTRSRFLRAALALGLCAFAITPVHAQEGASAFPSKQMRILVPFPPGGAADTFARFIGERLARTWSQPVVIENRPGGGGIVATQAAANAPADGYTLLVVTVGHAVNPHLHAKLPYDTEKDLQPVAKLASLPSVLVVNNNVPARSVAELLALAKAKPGKVSYASSGNATTSHVAGAMLASRSRSDLLHVPYKGSAPAITDLIGGQVDMIIDPLVSSAQHIKAGKLRALAISTAKRSPLAPELPTLAEAGVPGYDFSAWFVLLAPNGVPAPIVKKLNDEVGRILASSETREKYLAMGAEPGAGTPQELAAFMKGEIERYGQLVKATGMRAE
ncbi:Bug family tripartite tricarboxylate transporter substrate binding protein [Ramlibacter sp.]|uniref:Bug family tripartite tricarboxylate transporter substrate binding protein n=1 Tax=Ramlibacter sp. TaxID=1917967 RepID=UPI003D099AD8